MAQIPYNKLRNLRSGNTVWRVFGHMDSRGNIDSLCAEEYYVLGKKVLYHLSDFSKNHGSVRMSWKRFESTEVGQRPDWMYVNCARFLNDLHGYGCFNTRRSAERFVAEIKAGLHPEIIESMARHRDDMDYLEYGDDMDYLEDMCEDGDDELDSPSHHNMYED